MKLILIDLLIKERVVYINHQKLQVIKTQHS